GQAKAPSPKPKIEIKHLQHQLEGVGPAWLLAGSVAILVLQVFKVKEHPVVVAPCPEILSMLVVAQPMVSRPIKSPEE
ncbi:hypothetical protein HAX54_022373, partial [Datura stramonium]|nr:hypothetical protein [Datura stramonium]